MEDISPRFLARAQKCSERRILPYELSILDCSRIFDAIAQSKQSYFEITNEIRNRIQFKNAFDIYDFDRTRFLNEDEAFLVSQDDSWMIHWDAWQRFVGVAGPRNFCVLAFPFSSEIQKHYFLEETPVANEFDAAEIYRVVIETQSSSAR